ncbi:MAG TPA: hypothetical protein VG675_10820 [Bryobacteraceae bacterium]|nr:hypothetical protein [Bryobacteraceae bacterium]
MRKLSFISNLFLLLFAAGAAGPLLAQTVSVDHTALSFSAQFGGSAVSQTLNVTSTGEAAQFFVMIPPPAPQWLKVNPASGNTPSALTVTADPTGLNAGIYNASFTITSSGGSISVSVTLSVSSIGVSPQALQFTYQSGSTVPSGQILTVSGQLTNFNVTATTASGGNWLQAAPASSTAPASVSALLNPAVVPSLSAGTYQGNIVLTPTSGFTTTPLTVGVTLTVTAAPPVSVSSSTLAFTAQIGGTNNTYQQTLTISTTSAQPVGFTLTSSVDPNPAGKNWISSINPSTGTIPANGSVQVTIMDDPTLLPAGTYHGKITLATPSAVPQSQDVAVSLTISNNPLLGVPGTPLSFAYQLGGQFPAAQNVTPTSTGAPLAYTVSVTTGNNSGNWLRVTPADANTPTPFAVSVDPTGMLPGSYSGTVTVTAAGADNSPQQIPVTFTIGNEPLLVTNFSALSFPFQIGQSAPAAQTITVSTSTGATLNYSATASTTSGGSWLVLGGAVNGSTNGSFTASVNAAGLGAGTYDGAITITATNPATGAASPNSPLTIPVKLYVSNTALLVVLPALPPTFNGQVGGGAPSPQMVNLSSTSPTDQLNFNVSFTTTNGGNWLFVAPIAGATPGQLTISVIPTLLSAGTYTGTVTVTATGPGNTAVANSPLTIPVTLNISAGTLSVAPASLTFSQTAGAANPPDQTLAVSSSGPTLAFSAAAANPGTVSWLSVKPANGTTPGNLTVSVDGSKLTSGTFQGTITVASPGAGGSPVVIPVTFTISPGTISASPASLTFTQVQGGPAPAVQNLTVSGSPVPLTFSVSAATNDGNWLTAAPPNGTTPGTVQVSVSAGNMSIGTYQGTVTITSPGAAGSPLKIPVTLNVVPPQSLTASPSSLTFHYIVGQPAPDPQTIQVASSGGNAPFTVSTLVAGGNWLNVSPTSGNTPAPVTVSIDTQGLGAGNYTATLNISSPNSASPTAVSVTLTVTAVPPPQLTSITNAASYFAGAISPGENVVIFGTGLGPAALVKGTVTNGVVDTKAGDTQVFFDNIAAPIIYASATQTSVMVPYELAGRPSTNVRIIYQGVQSDPIPYTVISTAPGIYTLNLSGTGPGVIVNQDGVTVNGSNAPAAKSSVVSLYMTGEGATVPSGANGAIIPTNGSGLKKPQLAVTATVGGVPATVQYYGSAPGIVSGVMQVNVQIPAGAPSGPAVPIVVSVGTAQSQTGVTVAVQ